MPKTERLPLFTLRLRISGNAVAAYSVNMGSRKVSVESFLLLFLMELILAPLFRATEYREILLRGLKKIPISAHRESFDEL